MNTLKELNIVKLASNLCKEIQVEVIANAGNQSFTIEDAEGFFHCEGIISVSAPSYWPEAVKCKPEDLLIDVWLLESYYQGEEELRFTEEQYKKLCVELSGRVEFV